MIFEIEEESPVPVPNDPMKEMQEKFESITIPEEHGDHSIHGSDENGSNLLLNMPEGPLLDIFSFCDFVSVQSLRKTCPSIREFIDYQHIDPNFECLGFKFAENSIELYLYSEIFETEIELTYKKAEKTENSTTIIQKRNEINHEKIIRDVNFVDLFCQDFRVLTKSSKQIPYIFFTIETDNLLEALFENFQEILKIRNFKTSKLVFHVRDSAQILSILPFFDPNFLKTLYVQDSGTQQLNLTEVVKLEQWRRLENVHIEFFEVEHPMTFKDFNLLRIQPELTWTFR